MSNSRDYVDAELERWDRIKERNNWTGLLVGNGASCNIWDRFRYLSLYEMAIESTSQLLLPADQDIFTEMKTSNFEAVLAALSTAEFVSKALGQDYQVVRQHYKSIQQALIDALNTVHVPWSDLTDKVLRKIRSALLPYNFVYSTNYDLLLYWAIMSGDKSDFKDYLWGEYFDITDTAILSKATKILYLHGALHLIRLPLGGTRKLIAENQRQGDLLSQFGRSLELGETPLFITEGTARDKLTSIYRSDYLSFAYRQFINHGDGLVVFGHSLGESDKHLIQAIQQWNECTIAVSMRRDTPRKKIIANKAKLKEQLPLAQIIFFDAKTHPLGKPSLRIRRNGDNNL